METGDADDTKAVGIERLLSNDQTISLVPAGNERYARRE